MSNVIEFLERMGQDASLHRAKNEHLRLALCDTTLDTASQEAILDGNQHALEGLLGANSNVCCMIYPANEAPPPLSV